MKLCLLACDMITNEEKASGKLLKLIRVFSNFVVHKLDLQNSVAFPNTSKNQWPLLSVIIVHSSCFLQIQHEDWGGKCRTILSRGNTVLSPYELLVTIILSTDQYIPDFLCPSV